MPPERMLAAADALFAAADQPMSVSMDAIAQAAGVGKGTLFRAFGSRDALLDTLWAQRLGVLRTSVEGPHPELGPHAAPQVRAQAFMGALLEFKLAHRHLIRAREAAPQLLRSTHYLWMHEVLQTQLSLAAGLSESVAAYRAHALLASIHIDLLEELMAQGFSPQDLRQHLREHVASMLSPAPSPAP